MKLDKISWYKHFHALNAWRMMMCLKIECQDRTCIGDNHNCPYEVELYGRKLGF